MEIFEEERDIAIRRRMRAQQMDAIRDLLDRKDELELLIRQKTNDLASVVQQLKDIQGIH